jgi:CubicO group peptidase (beta-lactamase class C family)
MPAVERAAGNNLDDISWQILLEGLRTVRLQRTPFYFFVCLLSGCVTPATDPAPSDALSRMAESLHNQLRGDVVGYAFALGTKPMVTGAGGLARIGADGGPTPFTPDTPMIIASVSKLVSALVTIRLLSDHGLNVNSRIGPYFPSDWAVSPYIQNLTFAQLLSQKSGIKDFGNGPMSYQRLRGFFTQSVEPDSTTSCGGASIVDPKSPVTPNNLDFCYSNYNAAILPILLPKVTGRPEQADPQKFERYYERLVQEVVFKPVGVMNATCAPEDSNYALSYIYPGDAPGKDWGPQYARCATGGWYVSAVGVAKVLASIAVKDGRILRETGTYSSFKEIRSGGLGLDRNSAEMMEKNGVLGDDSGVLAVSALIFFPEGARLPAVLFTNSTNKAGRIAQPRPYLEKARDDAFGSAKAAEQR